MTARRSGRSGRVDTMSEVRRHPNEMRLLHWVTLVDDSQCVRLLSTASTDRGCEALGAVSPMLMYAEPGRAIEFLCDAFGFSVDSVDGDGDNAHAFLSLGDSTVSVWGVWRAAGFGTPVELGGTPSQLWCEVDDVDHHFERALAAGAVVIGPPVDQDYGFRTYRAIDPEGHRWYFAQAAAR